MNLGRSRRKLAAVHLTQAEQPGGVVAKRTTRQRRTVRVIVMRFVLLLIFWWAASVPFIGATEPTVNVTVISHFDRPWSMTAEDLAAFEHLTANHPNMRWTHLYNPVAYTQETPLRDEMERFVKQSRANHDAEIGVHLHMYKSLLDAAGVEFVPQPSLAADAVEGSYDESGYAVPMTRYSRDEIGRMLTFTLKTFHDRELGEPKTFCAGFYATSLDLQREIAARGFTTSAAAFPPGTQFGSEYAPSWHALSGWDASVMYRTVPYRVSQSTILPHGQQPFLLAADHKPLVELPQTCKIDWMVTDEDMKVIFKEHLAIARGGNTTAVCLAIHETGGAAYVAKYDEVLAYIDEHIASRSKPNVRYVTAAELRELVVAASVPDERLREQ